LTRKIFILLSICGYEEEIEIDGRNERKKERERERERETYINRNVAL